MPYDPAQRESFAEAARPLIRWLAENANPQCCVIVTNVRAELLLGEIAVRDESFLAE
jgi:hypothetical protein